MNITQISTTYSWVDNRQVVTDIKTERFDQGNSVTTVTKRSYEVFLYESSGQMEKSRDRGQHIDQSV